MAYMAELLENAVKRLQLPSDANKYMTLTELVEVTGATAVLRRVASQLRSRE